MAMKPEPVVVTGLGIASPLGLSDAAVIQALRRGKTAIAPVTVDKRLTVLMGRVKPLPSETDEADRALALAEWSARDALAQARIDADTVPGHRMMMLMGSSKGRIGNLLPEPPHTKLTLNVANFSGDSLGLQLAQRLGFTGGPVLNCPAACATGIISLIRGVHALQHDEADVVLAGSAESTGRALLLSAFQNMGALSPRLMRPFHADRCGFNPGEGGAAFVLERERDAKARGAHILARIAGWDHRSDATHMTGVDPSGEVLAYCLRRALGRAGWTPGDVEHINAHGTATLLNDIVEGRALSTVFGAEQPPVVSALKSYMGHLLGASSAVELALVIICARDGFVPGIPGLDRPDPIIPLRFAPNNGMNGQFRRILKVSLGFGGHIGVIALTVNTTGSGEI